jgi:DNA-binding transcriptional MerR regulator
MAEASRIEIPNRPFFKAAEVCELVKVQPYVLRSWENEFPELGAAKKDGGPRLYKRADVEQVLRIKHLLLVEGLTLAGARRRLEEGAAEPSSAPGATAPAAGASPIAAVSNPSGSVSASAPASPREQNRQASETRERLSEVKRGLRSILDLLSDAGDDGFALEGTEPGPQPGPRSQEQRHAPTSSRSGARKRSA